MTDVSHKATHAAIAADALEFVRAAKTWLEHTDEEAEGFDRQGSAVLMLDRAEEALAGLVGE